MTDYIRIPKWDGPDGFQHYKKRDPIWIKVYTRLHSDDKFLALTAHQRAVLLGLWIEYARAGRHLALNTASLSRRLNLRVMRRDIEHLETQGFVEILLAEGKHNAMPDKEKEKRRTSTSNPKPPNTLRVIEGGQVFDAEAARLAGMEDTRSLLERFHEGRQTG